MNPVLTGSLRLRTQEGQTKLNLTAQPISEVGERDSLPIITPVGSPEMLLELEENEFSRSLIQRTVNVSVSTEGTEILRQTGQAVLEKGKVVIGPFFISDGGLSDFLGILCLEVTVTNNFGVAAYGFGQPFFLNPTDNEDNRRLLSILQKVQAAADLLTEPTGSQSAGKEGRESSRSCEKSKKCNIKEYFDTVSRIIAVYSRQHSFFEKSARFRLQQTVRLTALSRVESVTHRTLEFIATHPEELVPTTRLTGIRFRRRPYLPVRTLDEINQKTFDIYENRCLVGFLKTVIETVQTVLRTLEAHLGKNIDTVQFTGQKDVLLPLQDLYAAYSRLFALNDVPSLIDMPKPSAIFISSLAYRPFFDLMQTWFSLKTPSFESLKFYVRVAKSSRLYEYYVLTKILKFFGEPESKWRINWPVLSGRPEQEKICNAFLFRRDGKEITVFYEPRIPAGIAKDTDNIGLVRTMMLDYSESGAFLNNPKGAYFTPDFVVRIRKLDETGYTKFWIADAKYSTWPTVLNNYANHVMVKYLLQTSPSNLEDQICGLTLFCGKDHGARPNVMSLRNVDNGVERSTEVDLVTLSGQESEESCELLEKFQKFCQ